MNLRHEQWAMSHMKRLKIPDKEMFATCSNASVISDTKVFVQMIWNTLHTCKVYDHKLTATLNGSCITVERFDSNGEKTVAIRVEFGSVLTAAMWARVMLKMGMKKGKSDANV